MKPNGNLWQTWLLLTLGIALGFGSVLLGRRIVELWFGVHVVNVYPRDDDTVSATTPIGVEFSAPMQPQSVEGRFHLTPIAEGLFEWEGGNLWYRPTHPLQPSTTYTVGSDPGFTYGGNRWDL